MWDGWIDGSGLMEILNFQKLSTIGVSAVVDVNSIKRATYCLQVIFSTLYIKLSEAALLDEAASLEEWSFKSPYDWLSKKASKNEMCFFWKMVFDFEATYLMFLRAEREENFELYITTLRKLVKWYFIFDKFHYSRWLTIHIFDLITLPTQFPDI